MHARGGRFPHIAPFQSPPHVVLYVSKPRRCKSFLTHSFQVSIQLQPHPIYDRQTPNHHSHTYVLDAQIISAYNVRHQLHIQTIQLFNSIIFDILFIRVTSNINQTIILSALSSLCISPVIIARVPFTAMHNNHVHTRFINVYKHMSLSKI